jgi:hypothetical protein
MFYVYAHIQPESGIPFYIGKGSNDRMNSKKYRNDFWNKVVSKHGFESIIIEDNLTEKESFDREVYWISRIGMFKDGGTLTNICKGGIGGYTILNHPNRELIIEKIKKSLLSRPNPNLGGKCCTEEWREKQSNSQSKVKLKVTDTFTGEIMHFSNSKECAKHLNAKPSNVRTCKGKYKLMRRYIIE